MRLGRVFILERIRIICKVAEWLDIRTEDFSVGHYLLFLFYKQFNPVYTSDPKHVALK